MQPTSLSYKPKHNTRKKTLIVLVFLSLLASLFPYPLLTSQAKNQKIIASKPQNEKISKNINIPVEYKTYYEDASTHKEIKKLIEANYKKYHAAHPSKDNQIACNGTVKNRLLCVIALEKDESTFANRFAGNLVTYTGAAFTLKIVGDALFLVAGIHQSASRMDLNQTESTRVNVAIGVIVGGATLSTWLGTKISAFGQSLKKNPKSHIIIYDIRDCNTDPQCPDHGSKNKSAKKSKKTTKKTKL